MAPADTRCVYLRRESTSAQMPCRSGGVSPSYSLRLAAGPEGPEVVDKLKLAPARALLLGSATTKEPESSSWRRSW